MRFHCRLKRTDTVRSAVSVLARLVLARPRYRPPPTANKFEELSADHQGSVDRFMNQETDENLSADSHHHFRSLRALQSMLQVVVVMGHAKA